MMIPVEIFIIDDNGINPLYGIRIPFIPKIGDSLSIYDNERLLCIVTQVIHYFSDLNEYQKSRIYVDRPKMNK
jgi:hypothetical protein